MKHSEPIFSATGDAGSGYEAIQKSKIRREKNLGLIIYGWGGDVLAWESNFGSHSDINHQTGQIEAAFDNSRTTHYIYEPNSFVPMIQASRPGRIQLLPTPDYDRFRRGEAQYDIDQDPVWHYQAKAQPFDAVAFYQCDHLGTPQELTDMNGEIAWAAEYKAWGYAYDALSKAGRQAGLKQPLRFQGQYYDHETGLHYNRHRYYDPRSGRFVSKDPIGLDGGINVHAYAPNSTQWVDPLGLATMAGVLTAAGTSAAADGPLPIGDAVAAGIMVIGTATVAYQNREAIASSISKATDKAKEKLKRKCMAPTVSNVRAVCVSSGVFTYQRSVSLPRIAAQVAQIEMGQVAPPVYMVGNAIVDGNHRYISNMLCHQLPARQEWAAPTRQPQPLANIEIDLFSW